MPLDILLVDDNRDATELLEELLSMEGHAIRTAATAQEALALARAQPAQVLLVDQNLPDMQGSDLVPLLRAAVAAHGAGPCFAIAITGMASGVSVGAEVGQFDYVLGKPLDFDAFDAVLAKCAAALQPPTL
ncbi:response regulator [Acidovorax sp. sic0104]|uniref:response regulator n=1 Tax=Acidovorax sp. sic0104 TaxID=2854784 RepID=UPI001C471E5E|nr:response regulator [Acidovorax sp. sic0104]MBV7539882.1 response regulator [Acidovorax sp. sic0104]